MRILQTEIHQRSSCSAQCWPLHHAIAMHFIISWALQNIIAILCIPLHWNCNFVSNLQSVVCNADCALWSVDCHIDKVNANHITTTCLYSVQCITVERSAVQCNAVPVQKYSAVACIAVPVQQYNSVQCLYNSRVQCVARLKTTAKAKGIWPNSKSQRSKTSSSSLS